MPIINRLPINSDTDDDHHKALVSRQTKMIRNMILPEIMQFKEKIVDHGLMALWLVEMTITIATDPTQ